MCCKKCGKVVKKQKLTKLPKSTPMNMTCAEVNHMLVTKERLQELCSICHKLPMQSHCTRCGICEMEQDKLIRALGITGFKVAN